MGDSEPASRPTAAGRSRLRALSTPPLGGRLDLDRAARDLNGIYTRQGLETARLLGNYIIEHFFDGDVTRVRERGTGYASFRQLAERDDLQMSASALWTSVAVVEQLQMLPAEVAEALPLSHHRLLLPLREPDEKLAVARKAAARRLTKRQLEQEIKRRRNHQTVRRGRRPKPLLLKALSRLQKDLAFTMEQAEDTSFDRLPRKEAVEALEQLHKQLEQARSVLALLHSRL